MFVLEPNIYSNSHDIAYFLDIGPNSLKLELASFFTKISHHMEYRHYR